MTHPRNTPASSDSERPPDADRFDPDRTDRDSHSAASDDDRSGPRPTAPRGREERTFPAEGYEGRAYRARAEPMTVRPLRDGRYVVEHDCGTYVVTAERAACTCPDSAIRGARCKHVRRVTLEIAAGLVPAPDEREAVCAVCGDRAFVPVDDRGPALCDRHDHDPGDIVADRETGTLLVVVEATGERADEARTEEGRIVADYGTNASYGGHEPVFAVSYVDSLPAGIPEDPQERSVGTVDERRYLFPASRLRPVEIDGRRHDQPAKPDHSRQASPA